MCRRPNSHKRFYTCSDVYNRAQSESAIQLLPTLSKLHNFNKELAKALKSSRDQERVWSPQTSLQSFVCALLTLTSHGSTIVIKTRLGCTRLYDAVDLALKHNNPCGGYSTADLLSSRAPTFLWTGRAPGGSSAALAVQCWIPFVTTELYIPTMLVS